MCSKKPLEKLKYPLWKMANIIVIREIAEKKKSNKVSLDATLKVIYHVVAKPVIALGQE